MKQFRTISIKTQVRRLRYFTLCVDYLKRNGVNQIIFSRKIENWVSEHKAALNKYYAKTGYISFDKRHRASQSFQNYLEGFSKLGLYKELNGFLIPTKLSLTFKLLKEVLKKYDKSNNAYKLTELERVVLTYFILKFDGDIFLIVLKLLNDNHDEPKLHKFKKEYKDNYLKHLNFLAKLITQREKSEVLESINRTNAWRNEERYLEDIIPPRLNWMLDLGLLKTKEYQEDERYVLNEKGLGFIRSINIDVFLKKGFSSGFYYDNQVKIISTLSNQTSFTNWITLTENKKNRIFKDSMFFILDRLTSLNIPRLSLEQSFLFISIYALFKEGVLVEFPEIESFLKDDKIIEKKVFSFRKAARESESYIVFKNA